MALWKRKRTLVAFDLFLVGFAFTLFIGLIGFAFILLGGWLMLRAWRLNKYGTTNAKAIAREAATPTARTGTQGSGEGRAKVDVGPGCSQTADREQALHAEIATSQEDPQAHRVRSSTIRSPGSRHDRRRS